MKASCPDCGAGNALDVWDDGEVACVACGHTVTVIDL